jgi:hypothetical protein
MTAIPVKLQREFGVHAQEEVTFTQTTAEAFHYRDAIQFGDGRHVLLQSIREGLRFEVLASVSSQPAQRRIAHNNVPTRLELNFQRRT